MQYNQTEGNRASQKRKQLEKEKEQEQSVGGDQKLSGAKSELDLGIGGLNLPRGSSMMIAEDISARGDQQSFREMLQSMDKEEDDEDTPSKAKGQIKQSQDCEMFNRIKLGKKLGEGAYGSVYQALSLRDHKFIVVKKIRVPDNISKDALNEIDMLSKLEHHNIVKYYDSCLVNMDSEKEI